MIFENIMNQKNKIFTHTKQCDAAGAIRVLLRNLISPTHSDASKVPHRKNTGFSWINQRNLKEHQVLDPFKL